MNTGIGAAPLSSVVTTTPFVLLPAQPRNRVEAQEVTLRSEPVPVALCVSSGGRPPAKISWLSPLRGEPKESEMAGPLAGTVTVTSRYAVVPSSQVNGVQITCKVEHEALEEPDLLAVTLSVRCECTSPAVHAGFPGHCLHCPSVLSTLALGHILPCLPSSDPGVQASSLRPRSPFCPSPVLPHRLPGHSHTLPPCRLPGSTRPPSV